MAQPGGGMIVPTAKCRAAAASPLCTFLHLERGGQILPMPPGTRAAAATFSRMDRFFLAVIISALLLAAVAVGLFVASTGGERTLSVMNLPPAAGISIGEWKARPDQHGGPVRRDGSGR